MCKTEFACIAPQESNACEHLVIRTACEQVGQQRILLRTGKVRVIDHHWDVYHIGHNVMAFDEICDRA